MHIERAKVPFKAAFQRPTYRKHFTMAVMHDGKRMRFVVPVELHEGAGDEFPILVGVSGVGSTIEEPYMETVEIDVTTKDDTETQIRKVTRRKWRVVVEDCDHPVLGPLVAVLEPSLVFDEEAGELRWEEDVKIKGTVGGGPGSENDEEHRQDPS